MPDLTKRNSFFKGFLRAIFKMDFNPNSFFILVIFRLINPVNPFDYWR